MALGFFFAALVIVAVASAYATWRIAAREYFEDSDWQDRPGSDLPRIPTNKAPFHMPPPDVEPTDR